jgi:membrane protein
MTELPGPKQRRGATAWVLLRDAAVAWSEDRAPRMGAALSYYTVFSLSPLLLIGSSGAGLVFGPDAARGEIFGQLRDLLGPEGARVVESMLQSVNKPAQGWLGTAAGVVLSLIGATTVFAELQSSLDQIWRADAPRSAGIWAWLRARVLSFGLIMGIGFLLMVSLVFSAAVAALHAWWSPIFGNWAVLMQGVNVVAGYLMTTGMFAMIYKIIPSRSIAWRDVWVGAAVTALLFTLGRTLIGLYIGTSGVSSGFGAAGSLVVLLLWVYYSAQIFLFGAEFTWVYAHARGSRSGEAVAARPD